MPLKRRGNARIGDDETSTPLNTRAAAVLFVTGDDNFTAWVPRHAYPLPASPFKYDLCVARRLWTLIPNDWPARLLQFHFKCACDECGTLLQLVFG